MSESSQRGAQPASQRLVPGYRLICAVNFPIPDWDYRVLYARGSRAAVVLLASPSCPRTLDRDSHRVLRVGEGLRPSHCIALFQLYQLLHAERRRLSGCTSSLRFFTSTVHSRLGSQACHTCSPSLGSDGSFPSRGSRYCGRSTGYFSGTRSRTAAPLLCRIALISVWLRNDFRGGETICTTSQARWTSPPTRGRRSHHLPFGSVHCRDFALWLRSAGRSQVTATDCSRGRTGAVQGPHGDAARLVAMPRLLEAVQGKEYAQVPIEQGRQDSEAGQIDEDSSCVRPDRGSDDVHLSLCDSHPIGGRVR